MPKLLNAKEHLISTFRGSELYKRSNFSNDIPFNKEIEKLFEPFYESVKAILERETAHNKQIFYARDHNQQLAGSVCQILKR